VSGAPPVSLAPPAPAPGRAASSLDSVPRPRGRDLGGGELEQLVRERAARPELWIERVRHDATQRVYEELLADEHLTAWLICWMDDHDTGFHDHDISSGAVAVVGGRVREERLTIGPEPRSRSFAAGEAFHFSPSDIHRVRHSGCDPAVTLHVYSPPLARMGAYEIDGDGVLARRPMASSEELRAA
jgi:predicted metal-dependent enzyme (double-stranded beta helix superfamily)